MNYEDIEGYTKCSCGAITIFCNDGRNYSCKEENFSRFFPYLDLENIEKLHQDSYCCDHCVNHYGLDLCACGSGEPFEDCKNGYDCCGQPSQILGERDCYIAKDSWLRPRH